MKPICKPTVNTQLDRMNGLQRVAESFRHSLLSIEFWISPSGNIREWLRRNIRWSAVLVIPTATVLPFATLALWELSSCINALTAIVGKLIFLPILVLLALVSITIVCRIISAFKR